MRPSVSIIIPVYNVEDYIEDCLKSVISQTYQGKIECIIVDDCTPDNSCKKIEEILSTYTGTINFKIIHHEKNKGLSAARNTGIKNAIGEWIYFLDSDDELYDYTIRELTNNIDDNDSIIVGSYSIINLINKNAIFNNGEIYNSRLMKGEERIYSLIESKWNGMAWNKLLKKELIIKHNLYFKTGIIHEDELWIFNILTKDINIRTINTPTYKYKQRIGSIIYSTNIKEKESIITIIESINNNISHYKSIALHKYFQLKLMSTPIKIFSNKISLRDNYYLYKRLKNIKYKVFYKKSSFISLICNGINNINLFNFIILYIFAGLIKKGYIKCNIDINKLYAKYNNIE